MGGRVRPFSLHVDFVSPRRHFDPTVFQHWRVLEIERRRSFIVNTKPPLQVYILRLDEELLSPEENDHFPLDAADNSEFQVKRFVVSDEANDPKIQNVPGFNARRREKESPGDSKKKRYLLR